CDLVSTGRLTSGFSPTSTTNCSPYSRRVHDSFSPDWSAAAIEATNRGDLNGSTIRCYRKSCPPRSSNASVIRWRNARLTLWNVPVSDSHNEKGSPASFGPRTFGLPLGPTQDR